MAADLMLHSNAQWQLKFAIFNTERKYFMDFRQSGNRRPLHTECVHGE